jgi:VIT1/CCC1 family predicted Fe2+/Mn2+ transporter
MPHLLRATRAGALDPVDRACEVVFGLLMAMTFVGTIAIVEEGREGARTLLFAALGCNIAWGIADAVMYLVALATAERRHRALLRRLHDADAATGRRIVAEGLMPDLADALDEGDVERLRLRLVDAPVPSGAPRLRRENYRAALGVFVLVVLATFPVALPYLFFDDVLAALRASQAIAIATLFAAGAALARWSGGPVLRTGCAVAALGAVLVVVIVLLGG